MVWLRMHAGTYVYYILGCMQCSWSGSLPNMQSEKVLCSGKRHPKAAHQNLIKTLSYRSCLGTQWSQH